MLILTIRTDKPDAELRLFQDEKQLYEIVWQAHRELGATIHNQIAVLLQAKEKRLPDIEGIVAFRGPGSFTGLRIGLSVANALADGLGVQIVASQGETWESTGITRLKNGEQDPVVMPEYGAPVHITQPKH